MNAPRASNRWRGRLARRTANIHVVEPNIEVTVAGMTVKPGNVIHADQHGAVVIPANAAHAVAEAADLITPREGVGLKAVRESDATFEKIRQAMAESVKVN